MRDYKAPSNNRSKKNRGKGNRRKREKQPRDWRVIFHRALRLAIFSGSVTLAAGTGVLTVKLVSDSGFFHIDQVTVENHQRVTRDEIFELSDIHLGSSIFDLDLEMIGGKIEENPWVARADVRRVFPRRIEIAVQERQPQAIINLGYLYYVDGAGEIFKVLDSADSLDFPVISGVNRDFLLQRQEEARTLLADAMGLMAMLKGRAVFGLNEVSEVHVDPLDGLTIYTCKGGVPVRLGFSGYGGKLDRLERVYPEIEPRLTALKYIDLNVMDRVIVKLDSQRAQQRG